MRRLFYRIYIRWLAIGWLFQINLGDEVWYQGRKRVVVNWAGQPRMTLGNPYEQDVPLTECRKVRSLANMWNSYSSGVRFYTGYWLEIWVRNGIEQWVRDLAIWPRKSK